MGLVNCPFAKRAVVWENEFEWDEKASINENVDNFVEADLKPFIEKNGQLKSADDLPIDGIVLEAPGKIFGKDVNHFAEFFRRVMVRISPESVRQLQHLQPDENGIFWDDGWQFSYDGERLFIITLAPYYPETNSRNNYQNESVMIFFQPEWSFRKKLGMRKEIRDKAKSQVRKKFKDKNQDYQCNIMLRTPDSKAHEAPRYVKPTNKDDEAIRWWIQNDKVNLEKKTRFRRFAEDAACMVQ
jgi:hypothetical protein